MFAPPPLPRTLEASVRDLASARPQVRASAVADLVRHARGDDETRNRAIALLIERLTDADLRVRAAACVGLGDLEATEAVMPLLLCVEDPDAYVRQMALNAIGEIKDERAVPRLRRTLTDERPEVRYQGIIAFTRVAGDAEVADALLDATHDDDEAVAHIALRLAEERVDHGKPTGEGLASRARALLGSGSPSLALVCAIVLVKLGDPSGRETAGAILLEVVRTAKVRGQVPDKEDERAAVEVIGELGRTEATPALERRAWGALRFVRDTCPFHAKVALARMGHDRAKKEILADLSSTSRAVLAAAVVAAGRAKLHEAESAIRRLPTAAVDPELVHEALSRLSRGAG
jgi:hypothetical protein